MSIDNRNIGHPSQLRLGWRFFGKELKLRREDASITQQQLGDLVYCSGGYVSQFEQATRRPQLDIAKRLDEVLKTDGFFARLCKELIDASPFDDYFRAVAELEPLADTISQYGGQVVPGLLQTRDYARAVFRAAMPFTPQKVREELVQARMDRQNILERVRVPLLWAVLDESVLRRPVGSDVEMAAQLDHLVHLTEAEKLLVQVLPFSSRAHALLGGTLKLMTFPDAPPVAYVEGAHWGETLDDPAQVARQQRGFDLARAAALPPDQSVALLRSLAKEYRPDERP